MSDKWQKKRKFKHIKAVPHMKWRWDCDYMKHLNPNEKQALYHFFDEFYNNNLKEGFHHEEEYVNLQLNHWKENGFEYRKGNVTKSYKYSEYLDIENVKRAKNKQKPLSEYDFAKLLIQRAANNKVAHARYNCFYFFTSFNDKNKLNAYTDESFDYLKSESNEDAKFIDFNEKKRKKKDMKTQVGISKDEALAFFTDFEREFLWAKEKGTITEFIYRHFIEALEIEYCETKNVIYDNFLYFIELNYEKYKKRQLRKIHYDLYIITSIEMILERYPVKNTESKEYLEKILMIFNNFIYNKKMIKSKIKEGDYTNE